jgi:rRNA small subunit aminocarboxypropyltransferase
MRLIIYHANEDDPKKCTARKLARFGFVRLETNIRKTPRDAILLNPFSKKCFSKEDKSVAEKNGILAVDCSWKNAERSFDFLDKRCNSRALPFVIAVNPVNYGKAFMLTTLEAFATALYILDDVKKAEEMLNLYKWGPHFLELNREPLDGYRKADSSAEVIKIMKQYLSDG